MGEGSSEHRSHGHRHSKHHSEKRSKHSHSKHKHRHRHHHHHKKRHKHHSTTKVELDEHLIQNTLETIEVDVLEAIRVPETLDLLMETTSQSDNINGGSEDSDSTSSDEEEAGSCSQQVTSKTQEVAGAIKTQDSGSDGTESRAALEGGSQVSDKCITDGKGCDKGSPLQSGTAVQSDSKTVLKSAGQERGDEGAGDDNVSSSEEDGVFVPANFLQRNKKKVFTINIKSQLGDVSNNSTPSEEGIVESNKNLDKGENEEENKDELKSPNTVTVESNGAKVMYVNLKPIKAESSTATSKPSEKDEINDSDAFGVVTNTGTKEQEEGQHDDTASVKETRDKRRLQKKHSRSRSRSRSRSNASSKTQRRSKRPHSKSRRKSWHRRCRSRSHSHSRKHRSHRSRSRSHSDSKNSRSPSPYGRSRYTSYRNHRDRSRSRSRTLSHSRYGIRRSSKFDSRRRRLRGSSSPRYHSRRNRSQTPRRRRKSSRSKSRSRSRTPSKEDTHTTPPADPKEVVKSISVIAGGIVTRAKQVQISELTAFCEGLQKRQAVEDEFGPPLSEEEANKEEEASFRTPFNVQPTPVYEPGLVFHNNAWKTANQVLMETAIEAQQRPLEEKFPVSTGVEHKSHKEEEGGAQKASESINIFAKFQPVSVGDLVVKRLEATRQLQLNPNDLAAQQTLAYIEQQTAVWAESQLKPGQFTGQQKIIPLTKDLHKEGRQAWAKKNMFRDLAPVMSGFGMKMLKKMGWEQGKPLGKMGEGHLEPIAVDVKLNRSGLSTEMDKKQPAIVLAAALQATGKANHLVEGKNPISALQEICAKKHWITPQYDLVMCGGPPHMKTFLFQVTIPIGIFQPATASNNKKQAKAQAATAALQGLGFMPKTIDYSASYS